MISNITTIDSSRDSQKDESLELIKAQNLKIQNLYSEIEIKDNLITKYLTEMKKFSNILDENNLLKNKLNEIENNENFIQILQNDLKLKNENLIEFENKFNNINY